VTETLHDEETLHALEERARPVRALYDHWERTQWGVLDIDFATDAATFAALGEAEQQGFVWIFAHRFHAEFNVARLLAPFLAAAPSYEMELLLATQIGDEHKHLQCVLRIYEEVFGVKGGIAAVRELADRNIDPVASMLYEALDRWVLAVGNGGDERAFLQAVFGYHLLGEGVVARTAQNLAIGQYESVGDFPGLIQGQRLVARDEARHIGIGVSYARSRLTENRREAVEAVTEVLDDFAALASRGLEIGKAQLENILQDGYGVDANAFYAEAMRLLRLRLKSIGYLDEA
jgi:ribonucleotide reductase beta subunit family protein with ferritin-like domain